MPCLSLQERTYGANISCSDRRPSDTVPVSGTDLCNFIVEILHLMIEGEQELGLVRKGTLFFEAVHSIDCGFYVVPKRVLGSSMVRCNFSLNAGDSLCNSTFHLQKKKGQWERQDVADCSSCRGAKLCMYGAGALVSAIWGVMWNSVPRWVLCSLRGCDSPAIFTLCWHWSCACFSVVSAS